MTSDLHDELSALNAIYGDGTIVPTSTTSTSLSSPLGEEEEEEGGSTSNYGNYILTLPNDRFVALYLSIPDAYPFTSSSGNDTGEPVFTGVAGTGTTTTTIGTSEGEKRKKVHAKGYGTHILHLAREVLGAVWKPGSGEVCLFDVVEVLEGRLRREEEEEEEDGEEGEKGNGVVVAEGQEQEVEPRRSGSEERSRVDMDHVNSTVNGGRDVKPEWILSSPLTLKKSTFLARATYLPTPDLAPSYVAHLLETDKRAAKATHNIWAYRVPVPLPGSVLGSVSATNKNSRSKSSSGGGEGTKGMATVRYEEDFSDDGETGAGSRVLKLLQLMKGVGGEEGAGTPSGLLVVVSRWYGGIKLGPQRFACIGQVAGEAVGLLLA